MKALLVFSIVVLFQPAFLRGEPPVVSEADTLAAKDLDIHKYLFKATPADGQVVTMRGERFLDGKLKETKEEISYPLHNEPVQEVVLLINQSFFSDPDWDTKRGKNYRLAGVFKEKIEGAHLKHLGNGEGRNSIELEFDTPDGLLKYIFSVLVEDYETAKRRHPGLPEMRGWSYDTNEEP